MKKVQNSGKLSLNWAESRLFRKKVPKLRVTAAGLG